MTAAVPKYVGDCFHETPPGHNYNLYLQCWDSETWKLKEGPSRNKAMKGVFKTSPSYMRSSTKSINRRYARLIDRFPPSRRLTIHAKSIAPLVTGMGLEHPLDNGFAFLNPYGLPYLPGSGIKGVLRKSWKELHDREEVGDLFGPEVDCNTGKRGAVTFWDCIPEMSGHNMSQDIMTPHYGKYYESKDSPNDAGIPIPIPFLVIPPGSEFVFHVTADERLLRIEGLVNGQWKTKMQEAFKHACSWIGFGGKTSLGYGAMMVDENVPPPVPPPVFQDDNDDNDDKDKERLSEFDRLIEEIAGEGDQNQPKYIRIYNDFKENGFNRNGFEADLLQKEVAEYLKKEMQESGGWKEEGNEKKDKKVKRTQVVKSWLA